MNQINYISITKSPCVSLCTCGYENLYDMGINTSEDYGKRVKPNNGLRMAQKYQIRTKF